MATGGTAPPLIMASHSHSLLDQESTVSSPLSSPHAEGHDADHDDLDMKSSPSEDDELDKPNITQADSPTNATHEESDLSELETNDSEAETERLFNTPRKVDTQPVNSALIADGQQPVSQKHTRSFQISPGKPQGQARGGTGADSGEDDHDEHPQPSRIQSDDSSVARKRKRSSPLLLDDTNSNEPPRKRSGSILDHKDETSLSKPTESTGDKSAEHSGKDDDSETPASKGSDGVVKIAPVRAKSKRSHAKKLKESVARSPEAAQETEGRVPDEEHPVEDEPIANAEVDEEARHEEELEKKRQAFVQLSVIEKHFAILRERLYEERLKALNDEEALLTSDTPTHPEYIAMMECINSRRDERLKRSEIELKFEIDAVDRWAVACRAQIFSQYYQSVRDSREKTMDELGKQWYEIQHERRKAANQIPEYGLRFPKDKAQQKKQAIAHNKETSILAGVAQHHGFPAAPEMKAASQAEIEDDFEAMHVRARQSTTIQAQQHRPTAINDYGAVPFGQNLGPAGEQFLEQTPWANPRHPSHHGARRHSNGAYGGPPAFSHQGKSAPHQAGAAWLANGQTHGDYARKHAAAAPDQEMVPARKTAEASRSKREVILS